MKDEEADFARELEQIRGRYNRRVGVRPERYDLFTAATLFLMHEREHCLIKILGKSGWRTRLPEANILDIGCGVGDDLTRLRFFGAQVKHLHGVDLLESRVEKARTRWPELDICQGNAAELPYPAAMFDMVLQSTVFSSLLDQRLRMRVAAEMMRVMKPNGIILWYDMRIDNPRNPDVHGLSRRSVKELFAGMRSEFYSVTLAPPIARLLVPRIELIARLLGFLPFLRTHYWATLSWPAGSRHEEALGT